jgi:hypothetical protein
LEVGRGWASGRLACGDSWKRVDLRGRKIEEKASMEMKVEIHFGGME